MVCLAWPVSSCLTLHEEAAWFLLVSSCFTAHEEAAWLLLPMCLAVLLLMKKLSACCVSVCLLLMKKLPDCCLRV